MSFLSATDGFVVGVAEPISEGPHSYSQQECAAGGGEQEGLQEDQGERPLLLLTHVIIINKYHCYLYPDCVNQRHPTYRRIRIVNNHLVPCCTLEKFRMYLVVLVTSFAFS